MQLARVHVMLEEYELSLPEYQQVLDLVADQTDAMLGKARALSALGRPLEAIAILDRIITMGSWLVGDAYYWRAWNRYHMKQLELANDDVAASLRLMSTARVHYLAGSIASARNQWPRAQTEFEAALTLDQTDCDIPLRLPVSLPDASRGLRQRNTSVRQPYVSSRRRRAIRPASMRSGMRRWTTLGAPDLSHAQRLRRTRPAIRKASRGSMLELRQRGLDNQRRRGSGRFKLASGQNGGTAPTHCWRSFANSACAIRRPLARHRRGDWPARG